MSANRIVSAYIYPDRTGCVYLPKAGKPEGGIKWYQDKVKETAKAKNQ